MTALKPGKALDVHEQVVTLQALLEGIDLPASKDDLIRYARLHEREGTAALLERLPDREYGRIDEVAEALAPVQPQPADAPLPHAESDLPPGGDDYAKAHPMPGGVRDDSPPDNPPQKAIEQQTKAQNAQKERQEKLLG